MIKKNFNELLKGVDLLIKFKPDVLDYLFLPENGEKFSDLYYSKSINGFKAKYNPEFQNNINKSSLSEKAKQFKTIAIFDTNYKIFNQGAYLCKFNSKNTSVWIHSKDMKERNIFYFVPDKGHSDPQIMMFEAILLYYLMNPYVELPAIDSNISYSTKHNIKSLENKPFKTVNLTSNHHKFRIRKGVNVIDVKNNCVYPSIKQAAHVHEIDYFPFYHSLCKGNISNLKRIERITI